MIIPDNSIAISVGNNLYLYLPDQPHLYWKYDKNGELKTITLPEFRAAVEKIKGKTRGLTTLF